jgi:ribonuclease P protein component
MVNGTYRLTKQERLSGKKPVEELFREGKSFFVSPFRILVREDRANPDRPSVRVAVSVPRRLFKRAVKRNLIKRRMREAYRLNKHLLTEWLEEKGIFLDIIFIYTSPEILSFREIEDKIVLSLRKILGEYEKNTD